MVAPLVAPGRSVYGEGRSPKRPGNRTPQGTRKEVLENNHGLTCGWHCRFVQQWVSNRKELSRSTVYAQVLMKKAEGRSSRHRDDAVSFSPGPAA